MLIRHVSRGKITYENSIAEHEHSRALETITSYNWKHNDCQCSATANSAGTHAICYRFYKYATLNQQYTKVLQFYLMYMDMITQPTILSKFIRYSFVHKGLHNIKDTVLPQILWNFTHINLVYSPCVWTHLQECTNMCFKAQKNLFIFELTIQILTTWMKVQLLFH